MPRREREKYFEGFRLASHAENYLYGEPQRALYSRCKSDRKERAAYWSSVRRPGPGRDGSEDRESAPEASEVAK
jgi:hypothetical protein